MKIQSIAVNLCYFLNLSISHSVLSDSNKIVVIYPS